MAEKASDISAPLKSPLGISDWFDERGNGVNHGLHCQQISKKLDTRWEKGWCFISKWYRAALLLRCHLRPQRLHIKMDKASSKSFIHHKDDYFHLQKTEGKFKMYFL